MTSHVFWALRPRSCRQPLIQDTGLNISRNTPGCVKQMGCALCTFLTDCFLRSSSTATHPTPLRPPLSRRSFALCYSVLATRLGNAHHYNNLGSPLRTVAVRIYMPDIKSSIKETSTALICSVVVSCDGGWVGLTKKEKKSVDRNEKPELTP